MRIDSPMKAHDIGSYTSSALKAVGVVGMSYGLMCAIGVAVGATSYADVATMIYQAAEPVIKSSAALFESLSQMAGASQTAGDLMPRASTEIKVATSGMFVGLLSSAFMMAGVKLAEIIDRK